MNYMKSNKNGVKFIAVVAALLMALSAAVIVMQSSESDATESVTAGDVIRLNNGTAISWERTANQTVFDIKGYVGYDSSNSIFGTSGLFEGVTGFAFLEFKVTPTDNMKIKQTNTALSVAYPDEESFKDNVKEKVYQAKDFGGDPYLAFLIPKDNTSVTIEITTGSATTTYTFNFKNVQYADVVLPNTVPTTLDKNYIVKGSIDISENKTYNLGNYVIASKGITFDLNSGTLKINAQSGGLFSSTVCVWVDINDTGSLEINGGNYYGGGTCWNDDDDWYGWYVFLNYGKTNTFSIKNANVVSGENAAVWFGNGPADKCIIDNCEVTGGRGVYLGTCKESEIKNSEITSTKSTALEIKSGKVLIEGCVLTSSSFVVSDGSINSSGTGSSETTLVVNNGYAEKTNVATNVKVVDTQIINTSANSLPVSVTAGTGKTGDVFAISFETDSQSLSQIDICKKTDVSFSIKTAESGNTTVTTATPTQKVTENTTFVLQQPVTDGAINVDVGKTFSLVATGDNSYTGTITLGNNSILRMDAVIGTFTVKEGSIYVIGDIESGEITLEDKDVLELNGSIVDDVKVRFTGTGSATVLIKDGDKLNLTGTLTLASNIKMNNDGELVGGGKVVVPEGSQFYTSKPVSVSFEGDGKIVLEDAIETLRLSDKLASSLTTEPTQKVIITGNLTIKAGQTLTIQGDLEVPEGVTVTVEKGGYLIIDGVTATANIAGTIKSAGSFQVTETGEDGITVTGTVSAEDKDTVTINAKTYLDGTISISSKGTAAFNNNLYVSETGVVDVKGTITGKIYNEGTVNINGSVSAGTTIYMRGVDAVVDIQSLKSGTLTVSDERLYLKTVGTDRKEVPTTVANDGWNTDINSVSFTNVKGVKVTEGIVYETDNNGVRNPYNYMYIAGAASVADSKNVAAPNAPVIVIATGKVTVADEFSFSKVAITVTATLNVTGTVTMTDEEGTEFTENAPGTIDVTGLVKTVGFEIEDSVANVFAVKYEKRVDTKTEYYYTNLADAIASGVTDLEVLGNITISKDTTIPAGISIDASGKTITVEDKVTFTVADGGYLEFGYVIVEGTFNIENTDTGVNKMANITSDTSVITEKTAMYTNLVNALANAESGTVNITNINNVVILSEDATVNENVTLVIPNSKTLKIRNGVTLTVAGTIDNKGTIGSEKIVTDDSLIVDNGFGPATKDSSNSANADKLYSVIKVTGTIVSASPMVYGTDFSSDSDDYNIPGAYYTLKTKYYITTIENAADAIKSADDCNVKIYGENKIGTVAFEGTASTPVTVEVMGGKLTVESMTVKFGSMKFDDVQIDGTFGSAVGTIVVSNMKTGVSTASPAATTFIIEDSVVTIDEKDVQKVVMTGSIENNNDKNKSTVEFNGEVVSALTIDVGYETPSAVGSVPAKYGSIVVNGTVTVTKNNMTIEDDAVLLIDGTVTVNDGAKLTAKIVTVIGVLDVQAKTDKVAAGLIDVDNLYIGGTVADVKVVSPATSAAASVNAPDTGVDFVYFFPGSTVTGALKTAMDNEDAKYTQFYVEDALWLTVYDMDGSNDLKIAKEESGKTVYNFAPTLKEKKFVAWQSKSTSGFSNVVKDKVVGDFNSVYANIEYNVYKVSVQAADGIDDVYIDGVLMGKTASGELRFSAEVKAGQHTISYTLANGYGGEAVMYINGDKTTGYTFTASGSFEAQDVDYKIILQGVEKTGYTPDSPDNNGSSDNGMSITDYLLIVLVVLIVIMAVLVAIRMMRS